VLGVSIKYVPLRSAPVFGSTVCAMIDQALGEFEFETRCRDMERRVAGIHLVSDLRKKVPMDGS
jgi:hypothetical protein